MSLLCPLRTMLVRCGSGFTKLLSGQILVSVHSELPAVCLSVCLSLCPRFPIRVKSTMADNLIERATWPVDLSRCRPISMPWEFVTQYNGNWGDVPRLSHLCTSFLERHFLCFIFFLFYFVTQQFLWHSLGKEKACFIQSMNTVFRYLPHQDVPLEELSR